MKIIVGLGNPGKKYENTRHNAGFMTVEAMVERLGLSWENNKKLNSLICKDGDTLFAKPQTFMNNSGQALQTILSYYKLLPKKFGLLKIKNSDLSNVLTVIHDDIDIELGKFKISIDSRSAGHKGIESIINHLKTKKFKRVRIGIRTAGAEKIPADKFVLQKFSEGEMKILKNIISTISHEVLKQ